MSPHRPRELLLYGLALLAVVFLGLRWLGGAGGGAPAGPVAAPEPTIRVDEDAGGAQEAVGPTGAVVVHVAGAVRRPGVYRMRGGQRIDDAVRRAGGATRRADLGALNLAAEVQDGRQVLVPARGRAPAAAGAPAPGAPVGAGAAGASATPPEPIDLNTATLEQLDTLEGIGPLTAQKILEARQAKGGFSSVEELGEIPGIGDKRLATLRERVRL